MAEAAPPAAAADASLKPATEEKDAQQPATGECENCAMNIVTPYIAACGLCYCSAACYREDSEQHSECLHCFMCNSKWRCTGDLIAYGVRITGDHYISTKIHGPVYLLCKECTLCAPFDKAMPRMDVLLLEVLLNHTESCEKYGIPESLQGRDLYRSYWFSFKRMYMDQQVPRCDLCTRVLSHTATYQSCFTYAPYCHKIYCTQVCWKNSVHAGKHQYCIECNHCRITESQWFHLTSDIDRISVMGLECEKCVSPVAIHTPRVSGSRIRDIKLAAKLYRSYPFIDDAEREYYKREQLSPAHEHDLNQECVRCGKHVPIMRTTAAPINGVYRSYCNTSECMPTGIALVTYNADRVRYALRGYPREAGMTATDIAIYTCIARRHNLPSRFLNHRAEAKPPIVCLHCKNVTMRTNAYLVNCERAYCTQRCYQLDMRCHARCAHCQECGSFEPTLRLVTTRPDEERSDSSPQRQIVCSKCYRDDPLTRYVEVNTDQLAALIETIGEGADVYTAAVTLSRPEHVRAIVDMYSAPPSPPAAATTKQPPAAATTGQSVHKRPIEVVVNIDPPAPKTARTVPDCGVCFETPVDCTLNPCGHTLCYTCAAKLERCPTCRKFIASRLRMYL